MAEHTGATAGTEEIITEGPDLQVHDSGHPAVMRVRATQRPSELGPVGYAEMAERRLGDERERKCHPVVLALAIRGFCHVSHGKTLCQGMLASTPSARGPGVLVH